MNTQLLIPLLITTLIAIGGWFIGHRLAAARDRANKQRELRVQYLIEAYRRLVKAGNHPELYKIADEIESAVSDIQLFGTQEQITKIQKFTKEMSTQQHARLDDLLADLRTDLRQELNLPKVEGKFWWLRIRQKK